MNWIRLREVVNEMDRLDGEGRSVPFDIKFVSSDRKRGTGGDIIEIKGARKCYGTTDGGLVSDTPNRSGSGKPGETKNPNHFVNQTRNLLLPNGQIRKVHIRLIIAFNGKKVCF
jgi:hypothetical protein